MGAEQQDVKTRTTIVRSPVDDRSKASEVSDEVRPLP
jgi:hypothetical protein